MNKCIDCGKEIDKRSERCYVCANRGKNLGHKHRLETKIKIRQTIIKKQNHKGIKNGFYGKHHPEEWKFKHSNKLKNKRHTEEHKRKISQTNKERWKNPETRKKRSEFFKKLWKNPEYRKKIIKSRIGKKRTKETRQKMSLAAGGTGVPRQNEKYPIAFCRIKPTILKRDNFTCQMSGMSDKEHLKRYGRVLEVHHIDYNKQNCKESNLITLSKPWNLKVNKNRKYWTKYFRRIIKCK